MTDQDKVLVTGGSGYIAGWCIVQLLRDGWQVNTTIRDPAREPAVRKTLAQEVEAGDRLRFFAADLMQDAGWADAMFGCSHVLHVASPIPTTLPRNDDELVVPAREGTLRVLRAAREAGVRRVVLTSSTAAVTYGIDRRPGPAHVFTEEDWTNPAHADTSPYVRSKAIAERAAWDWHAREGGALELVAVNPPAVLGPVLGPDFSASIEIVRKLMTGEFPACPRMGWPLVDVRDLADLHVRAMTSPSAAGQRFLAGDRVYWLKDIAAVLIAHFGSRARKVPRHGIPDWLVRLLSLFDPVTRSVVFELGMERPVSHAKAASQLGWQPRPVSRTIIDTADSLFACGVLR
ncbi:MAG: SDR family oxidoreductase [Gammaproteobacteria bacterium]